jgi:hypothetical protein
MDDLQTGVVGATTLLPPGHDTDDDDNSVADIGMLLNRPTTIIITIY